jgi:NDP-sugar pyrophosphorylase family protein
MKAIILAGGMGTRLRPVTYEIPKPLLTVQKKPIINHLIDLFRKHGIEEMGILINRQHETDFERWRKTWQSELPKDTTIFFEEKPRGTFGGLGELREWIGDKAFILSNGDELKDFDLEKLIQFHNTHKPLGTIALVKVPNPHEYGVPVLEGHYVKDFLEKPNPSPSEFISSGLYVLEPGVFDYADFSKEILMIERDIFPKMAKDKRLHGYIMEHGRWFDCGNLERWEKAIKEW